MKSKKYTLIELLISMGIFAVMMLLLLNFFSKYQDFTYRASLRNDLAANGQSLFAQMERDLKGFYYNISYDATGVSDPSKSACIVVGAHEVRFPSRTKYSSDVSTTSPVQSSGVGGLAYYKYSIVGEKLSRSWLNLISKTKSELEGLSATEPSSYTATDPFLSGIKVDSFNIRVYPTKASFLIDSDAGTGTYPSVYAVLVELTLRDTNTALGDSRKQNQLTMTKLIVLNHGGPQ